MQNIDASQNIYSKTVRMIYDNAALPLMSVINSEIFPQLQAFFNSPLYQKFLTECIQTVQRASHGARRGPERERDTCSSCSDTSSLSTSTQQVNERTIA